MSNQRKELDKLPDADYVIPALDQWKHWSKINDWDSRNQSLEGLITKLRRRQASSGEIQTLVTLCRPIVRRMARTLRQTGGDVLIDTQGDHQRQEALRSQSSITTRSAA